MTAEEKNMAIQKATNQIETIVSECSMLALRNEPILMQSIRLARGMKALRSVLTQEAIMSDFMPLQGTTLGFITDKDKEGGYDWQTVRECLIEALLRGFRPIGNEFNIIAGRFYGAKNGFERIATEYPGLTDLRIDLGVPQLQADKGALVPCIARWFFQGEEMEIRCVAPSKEGDIDMRIPVRVNSGMGADGILGKATRKLYARIYQRLTGCARDVIDADPEELPPQDLPAPATPDKDGRRISLKGKQATFGDVDQERDAIRSE